MTSLQSFIIMIKVQKMDIKKEIQHFRSQALMSRYESAIKLGNNLKEKLGLFQKVLDQDFTFIRKDIQQELSYCIQLNSFTKGCSKNQQSLPVPKIREEFKVQNLSKTSQSKKWKSLSTNQLKNQSQIQIEKKIQQPNNDQYEENLTIDQRIHKHIILPLNMPVFKLKSAIFLIRTNKCFNQVLQYLVHYDFRQFPNIDLCDLGVQNIVHCKQEMQSLDQKRVVIALQKQNNQQHEFTKKEIEKLKNIVQVYRETYEKGKVSKQFILALVFQEGVNMNLSEKSSFLKTSEQKRVHFE